VEIRASSGKTYVFQPESLDWMTRPPPPRGTWLEAGQVAPAGLELHPVAYYREFVAPYASAPPGTAKAVARFNFCVEKCWPIQYAVLDDGIVWYWNNLRGGPAPRLGATIGFLVGAVLLVLWGRRRQDIAQGIIKTGLWALLLGLAIPACTTRPTPVVSPPAPSPTAVSHLPDSFKGYELYSWQVNGDWQFTLITGTNRNKTVQEIVAGENVVREDGWVRISVQGVTAIQAVLRALPAQEDVIWLSQPHLGSGQNQGEPFALPPQEVVAAVQNTCQQLDLRLYVGG